MTDTPMTSTEAREIADSFSGHWGHYEHTRIKVALRAYADMLDRKAPDGVREAVRGVAARTHADGWNSAMGGLRSNSKHFREDINEATDAILALVQPKSPDGLRDEIQRQFTIVAQYAARTDHLPQLDGPTDAILALIQPAAEKAELRTLWSKACDEVERLQAREAELVERVNTLQQELDGVLKMIGDETND